MTQRYAKNYFSVLFLGWKYAKSKHLPLPFKSYFKHLIIKVAVWLRGIALVPHITSAESMFWFEYGRIFLIIFLMFTRKVLGSLFSIYCFTKHLFHMLILYLMLNLKTKHNFYSNEHALTAWLIVLHISCISC